MPLGMLLFWYVVLPVIYLIYLFVALAMLSTLIRQAIEAYYETKLRYHASLARHTDKLSESNVNPLSVK